MRRRSSSRTLVGSQTLEVRQMLSGVTAVADTVDVAALESTTVDVLANDVAPEGTSIVEMTSASHGTVELSNAIPEELAYEYESSGGAYYYGSIDAYVDDYYGGWQGYADYQSYVYGEDYTLPSAGITYTSTDPNYSGEDSFTYTIEDATGVQSTATVTVTIAGNAAPNAVTDSVSVAAGESVEVSPLANDSDPEGTELTLVSFGEPSNGTVEAVYEAPQWLESEYQYAGAYGGYSSIDEYVNDYYGGWEYVLEGEEAPSIETLRYIASDSGFSGSVTFNYTVRDEAGVESIGTILIEVIGDGPVVPPATQDDQASLDAGDTALIDVLANDTGLVSLSSVSFAVYGEATIDAASGNVRYVSDAAAAGSDQLTYTAIDGAGNTLTGAVTVEVAALAPTPVADQAEVVVGESLLIDVTANDVDPNGLEYSISLLDSVPADHVALVRRTPSELLTEYEAVDGDMFYGSVEAYVSQRYGSWELYRDAYAQQGLGDVDINQFDVAFDAADLTVGQNAFSYAITNIHGESGTATVTVSVIAPPPAEEPTETATPVDDEAETSPDGEGATDDSESASSDGTTSDPPGDDTPSDTETTSDDATNDSGNSQGFAGDDAIAVNGGEDVEFQPLVNDPDAIGGGLRIAAFSQPSHGTVSFVHDTPDWLELDYSYAGDYGGYTSLDDYVAQNFGSWSAVYADSRTPPATTLKYTSTEAAFSGEESFTYIVENAAGETAIATVVVTVTGVTGGTQTTAPTTGQHAVHFQGQTVYVYTVEAQQEIQGMIDELETSQNEFNSALTDFVSLKQSTDELLLNNGYAYDFAVEQAQEAKETRANEIEDDYNLAVTNADQAYTLSVSQLEQTKTDSLTSAQNEFDNALAAAESISDSAIATAQQAYNQAIEAAEDEYDAAEATARSTRDAAVALAQQARDASVDAADAERDTAFENAENAYNTTITSADTSLDAALQAASDARHAEIDAAQQAYDAIYAAHSINAADVSGAIAFLATWHTGTTGVDPAVTQSIQQAYDDAIESATAAFNSAATGAIDLYNGVVQPVYDTTGAQFDLAQNDHDSAVDGVRAATDAAVEDARNAYNDAVAAADAAHQATIDDLTEARADAIEAAEESAIDSVEEKAGETDEAVIEIEVQLGEDVGSEEDNYVEATGSAGASTAESLLAPAPTGDPVDVDSIGGKLQSDSLSQAERMKLQIEQNATLTEMYTALYEDAEGDEKAEILKEYVIEAFKTGAGQVAAARAAGISTHNFISEAQATAARSSNEAAAEHSLQLNVLGHSLTTSLIGTKAAKETNVSSLESQASIDTRGEVAELDTTIADEVKGFRTTVSAEDETWSNGVAESAHATEAAKIEAAATRDRAISNAYKAEADQLGMAGVSFAALSAGLMSSFYGTVDAAEMAYLTTIQNAEAAYLTSAVAAAKSYHEATVAAGEAAITSYSAGGQALSDAGFDADSIAIALAHYEKAERQSRAMFTERRSRLAAATTYVTETENANLDKSNTQQVANEVRKVTVRDAQMTFDAAETEAENDYQRDLFDEDAKRFDKGVDDWEGASNSANDAALAHANAAAAAARTQADAATNASHQASTQQISEDTKRHNAGVNAGKTKTQQSVENAGVTGTALADASKDSVETETELGKLITEETINITQQFSTFEIMFENIANSINDAISLDAVENGELHTYYVEAQIDFGLGSSIVVDYTGHYANHALFGEVDEPGEAWFAMTTDEALAAASSFASGFSDKITFGLTGYIQNKMGTDVYVDRSGLAYNYGRIGGEAWQFAFGMATGCVGFSGATKIQKVGMVYGYATDAKDLAELGGKVLDGSATVTDVALGLSGYAFGRVFSRGCFVAGTPVHLGGSTTMFVGAVGGYGAETVMSTSDSMFVEADMKWVVASVGLAAAGMLLMSGEKRKSKPSKSPAYARTRRKPDRIPEPTTLESLASYDELMPGFEPTQAVQQAQRGLTTVNPAKRETVDVQPSTASEMPYVPADEMFVSQPNKRPSAWKKWSAAALLLLASVCLFKGLPGLSVNPAASVVAAVESPVADQTSSSAATLPIEDIRCGMRVEAGNPLEGFDQPDVEIDPATWRLVSLFWETPTGSLEADTLRPLNWIDAHGGVGGYVAMGTSEIETEGYARITAIADCPQIQDGPGRIVTTTYKHSPKPIVDVLIEGELDPIGATGNHPFWSEDRHDFLRADQLIPGESLRRKDQTLARVTTITHRGPPEPVYNLEVDAEHVYRVGNDGVLVHDATCSGAKRGPKTDPNAPHNATIRVQADLLEAGGNKIIAGGGRLKEKLIATPGGFKAGRRPDILYKTPDGTIRGRNVGLTKVDGSPVKREIDALEDLSRYSDIPTDFVPYD